MPERSYESEEGYAEIFLLYSQAGVGILPYSGVHLRILNVIVTLDGEKPFFLLTVFYMCTFSTDAALLHATRIRRACNQFNFRTPHLAGTGHYQKNIFFRNMQALWWC